MSDKQITTPAASTPATPSPDHPAMPMTGRTPDPKAKDVLLLNYRPGFWTATHNEPLPPRHNNKEPYRPHRLVVHPGLCFVSGGVWEMLKRHNKQVGLALEEGMIEEVGSAASWHKLAPGVKEEHVLHSGHLDTLERLAEGCKGPEDLLQAFEDQIAVLRAKESSDAENRRNQRRSRRALQRGGFR